MNTTTSDHTMRPVRPLPDLDELASMVELDQSSADATRSQTTKPAYFVNPVTGRLVLCDSSAEGVDGFRAIRAADRQLADEALAVEHRALHRAQEVETYLRRLIFDATTVARDLRGLMLLFSAATEKAVNGEVDPDEMSHAADIVIDCARTMAARLDALEVQADEYQPGAQP